MVEEKIVLMNVRKMLWGEPYNYTIYIKPGRWTVKLHRIANNCDIETDSSSTNHKNTPKNGCYI